MRIPLKDLLEKLAVGHVLSPYETHPWLHYDEERGITCSAEIRMSPDGDEIEGEIQFLHDEGEDEEDGDATGAIGPRQQVYLGAKPVKDDLWALSAFTVKGEDYVNQIPEWDKKAYEFFQACIQAINMGTLPDIDDLTEKILKDDSFGSGGKRGKIGRKSPKVKPNQLLGLKGGM